MSKKNQNLTSKKNKVFVTGSCGFIGFQLCKNLLKQNFLVMGYDGITDYYWAGGGGGTQSILQNPNSNVNVYPNPTLDQITIDIKGYNGPVNVEVYDLQGRLLETTRTTTVSLRKYERGIYIFKVNYGEITEEVRVVRD